MSTLTVRRSRADLAAEVARLRADGLLQREVAELLGISRSYASAHSWRGKRQRRSQARPKERGRVSAFRDSVGAVWISILEEEEPGTRWRLIPEDELAEREIHRGADITTPDDPHTVREGHLAA